MTDKYIRIWNRADSVSRISLEKLGYSTKRNDPNTIGQFGSGIKFAPIAAIRNGMKWFFSGSDSVGEYTLEYIVQNEDGIDCIAYNYGDYIKPSSFTLGAGSLSWSDCFQIYREPVANAMDAVYHDKNDWGVDIVTEQDIKAYLGLFCVFITATPELMNVHNNYDKYFLSNRDIVHEASNTDVELYEKVDDAFRVYSHGVLVHCDTEHKSVYDYNIDNIELNEERNIKSLWDLEYKLTGTIGRLDNIDVIKNLIKVGMSADSDQYFEFSRLNSGMLSYSMGEDWKTSYYSMYGSNSVIYDKIGAGVDADRHLQNLGYHPTFIPNDLLYSMLVNSGIKSYSDSLNEEVKYEIDFDHDKYHKLGVAIEIASQFEPGIAGIVDMIGVWQSDDITVYGKTINMNKPIEDRIILINKDHVEGSNMADLVATIIHEYDHLSTGLRDGNQEGRMFRDLADKRIGRMMLKMFKQNAYNIVGDVLEFPLSKVHLLRGDISWEMSRIDFCNKIILRVGGCSFMINGDATYNGSILDRYENGNLLPNSSASALTVTSLANVKDVIALG